MKLFRATDQFQELVNARGAKLRHLNYEQLKHLDGEIEDVAVNTRPATIATIVESMADNSLRLVLQGFMPTRLFGIKLVALDGFYKYPDGTVKPMPDDEFKGFD